MKDEHETSIWCLGGSWPPHAPTPLGFSNCHWPSMCKDTQSLRHGQTVYAFLNINTF